MRAPPDLACRNRGVDRCGCLPPVRRCVGGHAPMPAFSATPPAGCSAAPRAWTLPRSSARLRMSPQEFAQALVAAGKDNKLTITPNGTGSSYTLRAFSRHQRAEGREGLLYSRYQRLQAEARSAASPGEQLVPGPLRRRPVERRRQRGDPQPCRQDRPADCRDPVGRPRCAASGRLRSATLPWDIPKRRRQTVHHNRHRPCPPRGQGTSDGDGFAGLRSPRRRHEVADRRHQEAALCQGG